MLYSISLQEYFFKNNSDSSDGSAILPPAPFLWPQLRGDQGDPGGSGAWDDVAGVPEGEAGGDPLLNPSVPWMYGSQI